MLFHNIMWNVWNMNFLNFWLCVCVSYLNYSTQYMFCTLCRQARGRNCHAEFMPRIYGQVLNCLVHVALWKSSFDSFYLFFVWCVQRRMLSYILSKVSSRPILHITGNATFYLPFIFAASTIKMFLTEANRIKAIYRIYIA